MNWFKDCADEKEIKTLYRRLAMQYHPDRPGGDTVTMQDVNAAYEAALRGEYRRQGMNDDKAQARWEMDEEIARKAMEIVKISDELKVEVCGVWIWITGETKRFTFNLKELACRWSPKKLAWYWRREIDGGSRWHGKRRYSLDEIRARYGSTAIERERQAQRDCITA